MKIKDTTKRSKTSGEDACLRAAPRHTAPPAPHARGQNPSRSACSLLACPVLTPALPAPTAPPAGHQPLPPGDGPGGVFKTLTDVRKRPRPRSENRQPRPRTCRPSRTAMAELRRVPRAAGARLASCLEADAVASLIFRRGSGGTERLGHPSEVTQQSLEQGVAPGSLALSCARVRACVCVWGAHACAGVRSNAFLITANTIGALTGLTGGGILIPGRAPCERSRPPTPRLPLRRHF